MPHLRRIITILGIATVLGGLTPQVLALPAQTIIAQADADTLFQQGSEKITAGDYQGAVEAFTKLLELNPKDGEAYYNRGLALAQLEQYEKAIADYGKVLELDPNDVEAYDNRAFARAQLEDYVGAIADYSQVLQRKADDAEAYYNRGLSHAQLEGSEEEAIKDLQKAAELFAKAGQTTESEEVLSIVKKLQQ
jgi:tetratricopeptide (TPR) repeat protein